MANESESLTKILREGMQWMSSKKAIEKGLLSSTCQPSSFSLLARSQNSLKLL